MRHMLDNNARSLLDFRVWGTVCGPTEESGLSVGPKENISTNAISSGH